MRWAHLAMAMVVVGLMAPLTVAQVAILTPRDGEVVRARRLPLRVQKPTPEGYVMVWLDGKFLAAIASPFELIVDLAQHEVLSGTHTLRVVGVGKEGQVEGEAQVQFQVDLTGAGEHGEQARLAVQGRTGEILVYSFQGKAETGIEVPKRAIRRKILTTRLTFRWLQTIRDITVDRVFRLIRSVEEGTLERETQRLAVGSTVGTPGMMGGEMGMTPPTPMMGSVIGTPPMMGGMPPMAPSGPFMGITPTTTSSTTFKVRLHPTEDQRFGWLSLLPNGQVVTGRDLPEVVQFVTGSIDLSAPDRPLQVGDTWQGTIALPKNLDNLTLVGSPTGAGVGGLGAIGGEAAEMPYGPPGAYGAPTPYGAPYGLGSPAGSAPPMMGRPGSMAGPMSGAPTPGVGAPVMGGLGAVGAPEAYLAGAPVVRVPALHRLDGFEFWRDHPCARIVSQFKIAAELDLSAISGVSGVGMGASPGAPTGSPMMGAPGLMGAPMGAMGGRVGSMLPMGSPPMAGEAMPGTGAPSPSALKLSGVGEGTRVLLFDLQRGQVVYAKVEVKVTFNTDYLTVGQFLPQQPTMAGAPGVGAMPMAGAPGAETAPSPPMAGAPLGAPYPGSPPSGTPYGGPPYGAPYSGAPTTPGAPFAPQPMLPFRNVPAKVLYTYTLENTLEGSGRLDFLLSGK